MPRWAVWYIRASFFHLLFGGLWGALLLATKGQGSDLWAYRGWHVDIMLFGWLTQFIWGVAFWIFPRFWTQRGREELIPWVWGLLNAGVLMSMLGVVLRSAGWRFLGHAAITAAAALFLWHAWPRVKPPGA